MREFVIWGKTPQSTDESLLLTEIEGERIRDRKEADRFSELLEKEYGCTETRVQCVDFRSTENLFIKAIN